MQVRLNLSKVLIAVGVVLVLLAMVLLGVNIYNNRTNIGDNDEAVKYIESIIPERSKGFKTECTSYIMPSVTYEGNDYIGVLNYIKQEKKVPIVATWNKFGAMNAPAHYGGSIYDGSLIVGGSAEGYTKLSFVEEVDIGDSFTLTDTDGKVYDLTVDNVIHLKDVSKGTLSKHKSDFRLFVKSSKSSEYLLVCMNM